MKKLTLSLLAVVAIDASAAETIVLKKGQTISEVLYERKLEVGATRNLYGRDSLLKKALEANPSIKAPERLKPGTVLVLPDELVARDTPPDTETITESEPEAPSLEITQEPVFHPSKWNFRVGYLPAFFDLDETTEDGELSASPFLNPIGLYASASWQKHIHEILGELRLFGPKSSPDLGPMIDLSLSYQAKLGKWFSVGPIATFSKWEGYALDVQNAQTSDVNTFTSRKMTAAFGGVRACLTTLCFDYQKALSMDFGNSSKVRKASGDGSGELMAASYTWNFYQSWFLVPRYEHRKSEDGSKSVESSLTNISLGILKEF